MYEVVRWYVLVGMGGTSTLRIVLNVRRILELGCEV